MAIFVRIRKKLRLRKNKKADQPNKKKNIERREHIGDEIGNLNPFDQDRDVTQGVDPNSRFI